MCFLTVCIPESRSRSGLGVALVVAMCSLTLALRNYVPAAHINLVDTLNRYSQ